MQEKSANCGVRPAGRRRGYAIYVSIALILLNSNAVFAAEDGDEGLYFEELPQIVTVTRLPQSPLESPASVTVIDRRMIDASGAVDIPDLLRLAAGFQVGHPVGTRTTVTYHGMSDEFARRMQVLVDGRSVYTPVYGGVEWPILPLALEDIDRIEVTRGPNGVTYGANSFLGVINIITLQPSAVTTSFAKGVSGDDGSRKVLMRQAGRADSFDYRLTLEQRQDNGLQAIDGRNALYDNKRIDRATFRGEYRADINDYISVHLGASDGTLGDGVAGSASNPQRDSPFNVHYQQLGWRHVTSSDQESELRFYHDYNDIKDSYQTAPLSELFSTTPTMIAMVFGVPDQAVKLDTSRTSERYNLEFQQRYRLRDDVRAVSGVEMRLDRVSAPGLLWPSGWIENRLYRLYTNGEWRIASNWLVNGGAMVEHNDTIGRKISPRIAVNHTLNQNQALRVSYTQAYRTPAMLEEYTDYAATYALSSGVADQIWTSRGGLGAERIDAFELALVGDHNSALAYELKLFQERTSNLIVTPMDRDYAEPNCYLTQAPYNIDYPAFCRALVAQNYGEALATGSELQFSYRTSGGMVSLAWSHLFKREGETLLFQSAAGPVYGGMEDWRPQNTVTLLSEVRLDYGFVLSGMVHHVDAWLNTDGDNARITTANARLGKEFTTGNAKGKLVFAVNDLMGSYDDFYHFMEITPKRYLGIEMAF